MVSQLSFAKQWAMDFISEYRIQRIDEWWNMLVKPSDTSWTDRIAELLRYLARKNGFQMEYEISTDFSWHKEEATYPSVVIEHENSYSQDIYRDELPKLLASNAQLKVLITYVRKQREESELHDRFKQIHMKRLREPITQQIHDEFLLMLDDYEGSSAKWRYYIFSPSGKVKIHRAQTKTVRISDVL